MRSLVTLTFRNIERCGALEARALELGSRLQRFGKRLTQCHMTLEGADGGADNIAPYVIKIELSVPGAQIHADSLHGDNTGHADVYLAMRDAFDDAKRQLLDLHCNRTKIMHPD
jgi:Sigma 54 modulation protein / S30EA ribosomal protein